jgi:mannose-6-phosphate isomerase-like protein (cupin superfamily)
MKLHTNCLAAGFALALMVAGLTSTARGQEKSGKVHWNLHLNETRGPIRSADMSEPSGKEALSEILGGPTSGSDNAYLIYTRMATGAHGPAMFTLPVEDDYVVLSGKMTVQIGTEKFVAGPYTGVVVPANTPHAVWNAESEPETNFEVITSGAPEKDLSRDLLSMVHPAKPVKVENAAKCIREIQVMPAADLKPGLNGQQYTSLTMGSPLQLRLDSALAGNGNNRTHVHKFEQVYFETEGDMGLTYGLGQYTLKKGDIAIIPIGVLHANAGISPVSRHLTLLLPQPPADSGQLDIEFIRNPAQAGAQPSNPAPGTSPRQ